MCSALISALCGALFGVMFDSFYKLHLENLFKFYFKKCDAIFLGSAEAVDVFTHDEVREKIKHWHYSIVRVGNELYRGVTFEDIDDARFATLFCNLLIALYITRQGRRKQKSTVRFTISNSDGLFPDNKIITMCSTRANKGETLCDRLLRARLRFLRFFYKHKQTFEQQFCYRYVNYCFNVETKLLSNLTENKDLGWCRNLDDARLCVELLSRGDIIGAKALMVRVCDEN